MLVTNYEWIFIAFFSIGCVTGTVQHGYMTHHYYNHKPVYVNDSMILELTNKFLPEEPGPRYLTCDVNIVTSESRKLMIHFLSLEISFADKDIDRLHIYDYKPSGKAVRISPPQGLYGITDAYYTGNARGVADYVSSSNRLKLDYQGKPTLAYNGFKILITSFREARGDCGRGYIRCSRRNICVPISTLCDGNPNCGNGDQSDETSCNLGPANPWNSVDGPITAVVAVALSCTLFFITAAVLLYVVSKLNKRDLINQNNITIEFKKKKKTKRQLSKTGEYAPPSYEVVIGMNDKPPPYQLVASLEDTGSDISDEESLAQGSEGAYATISETTNTTQRIHDENDTKSNNIQVTCDIHGNNVQTNGLAQGRGQNGCLELTKYRLCSQGPDREPAQRQASRRDKTGSLEIEVLESSGESETEENISNQSKSNGTAKSNGVLFQNGDFTGSKHNGQMSVAFDATKNGSEDSGIEFISNEQSDE